MHIDITPTAEETVRIYAYILAVHIDGSPYKFGDYWNYTEEQSEAIVKAYQLWQDFSDAWTASGLELDAMPLTIKKKFINAAIAKESN